MIPKARESIVLALFAALVLTVGVGGYMYLGDLSWVDALYMTIITLFTVGFREVPLVMDESLKLFTVFLLLLGGGVVLVSANRAVELVLDPRMRWAWIRSRMEQKIKKFMEHYVIFGAGRLGFAAAQELQAEGVPFVIIEEDEDIIQKLLEDHDWSFIEGNAMEESVLERAGVGKAKGIISCLANDPLNLMAVITARGLNQDCAIVTRATDEKSIQKLLRAGATKVVPQYINIGNRLVRSVTRPRVSRLIDELSDSKNRAIDLVEFEVAPGLPFVDKPILESRLRDDYGMTLLAIILSDGSINTHPEPGDVIRVGQTLVLLGPPAGLQQMLGH